MSQIDTLVDRYERLIALPWRKDLAGAQRAIFIVYDKAEERRFRARRGLFELATQRAGHGWLECDLTDAFARWMASIDYRDSYFESPEDLAIKLEVEFPNHVSAQLRQRLAEADDDAVVGVFGIASLYGFVRVSTLLTEVEGEIQGRVAVFFPGEYEDNNYRLLDARDGWNYRATPITVHEDRRGYAV